MLDSDASYHQHIAGSVEASLEIKKAVTRDEITCAVAIDKTLADSNNRADYITTAADNGGLSVATLNGEVRAFCCLDHGYFFAKPFISLLIVSIDARRLGLGTSLLAHSASAYPEVWTSTNRSNAAMRKLLDKAGWRYCGELVGLDKGDPERFYRTA